MTNFEDYYEILQVHQLATPEIITAAYRKLAQIHRNAFDSNPDPIATEKMKKINVAYAILIDPQKRKKYDADWIQMMGSLTGDKTSKPNPIIDPPGIIFKNIKPGETKKTSFLIINTGGSYSKINISNPDSWLKILDWHSISKTDELPLKVNVMAQADKSGKKRSENIYVALDNIQTHITVLLEPKIYMEIKDHDWHDIEFENLNRWSKEQFRSGNTEFKGKIFRYRLNYITKKYQFQLRRGIRSAVYDS